MLKEKADWCSAAEKADWCNAAKADSGQGRLWSQWGVGTRLTLSEATCKKPHRHPEKPPAMERSLRFDLQNESSENTMAYRAGLFDVDKRLRPQAIRRSGCRPFGAVPMFEILAVPSLYTLSDDRIEYTARGRANRRCDGG